MQLFELAKICLKRGQLHARHRIQQGVVPATPNQPLQVAVPFSMLEDNPDINKKHMLINFEAIDGVPAQPVKFVIPEGNFMKNDIDELLWMQNLSEFIANIQTAALRRCRNRLKSESEDVPDLRTRSEPLENAAFGARLIIKEGSLGDIPFEAMIQEIDIIKKQTLDGWSASRSDPNIMGKKFRNLNVAMEVRERLQIICETSGHDHQHMLRDIPISELPDGTGYRLTIPKSHLELARSMESDLGF